LEGLLAAQKKSRRKLLKVAEKSFSTVAGSPVWWKAG